MVLGPYSIDMKCLKHEQAHEIAFPKENLPLRKIIALRQDFSPCS